MSRYIGPKPGSGKAHQPNRTYVDRTPIGGPMSCKACGGSGRLSTTTIDGEHPEGFVTCPWCPTERESSSNAQASNAADSGGSGR